MFEKFTEGAIKVIMLSQEEARRMGHNFVGTEQLLLGIIGQRHGIGARALKKMKVGIRKTRKEIESYIGRGKGFVASEIPFTPRAKRVLEMSVYEAKDLGQSFVGTEHLLLAVIAEPGGVAVRTLRKLNINLIKLKNYVLKYIEEMQERILRPLTQAERLFVQREKRNGSASTLEEYAENITKEAIDGNLDPVIGRQKEIDDVIAVLARRRKNNPVLVGEPGVGKTAVAEGLAQLIVAENVPDFLDGAVIMFLDLGSVLAGTKYQGEFEERLKRIVEEAQNDPSLIVVIDEIHTLVGAGAGEGAVDAANILKPALARGKLRCIGATTNDEYRKYIERDPALERRFQPVNVAEPSVGTTIDILRGLRSKFEQHHTLSYQDKALEQAAILADKYVADRFLPDKAIDVLDEAGARVRLANRRLPLGLRSLLHELQETIKDKENCIKEHDFDAAKQLLDHELEVRTHIRIMKQSTLVKKSTGEISNETTGEIIVDSSGEIIINTNGKIRNIGLISDDSNIMTDQDTGEILGLVIEENTIARKEDVDVVTETDVADVIANWTGIPITKLTGSESERLLKMEDSLHKRIIGQHHAVVAVSKAIRRARVGLRNPNRPIASFIFAGPTGVGKTELTKTLSDYMFGRDDSMIRLDMSEYMEKHTVAKLIGSPPGYVGYNEGGQLTEAVRSKPYSVVLFDEVEKAHPDVFNLLLQILDDGRLSDSKGRVIDFTNTLIIMTTNLGSKIIERESGIKPKSVDVNKNFQISPDPVFGWEPKPEPPQNPEVFQRVTKLVNDELKNFFRPEFLNRIDEIIVFSHLTKMDTWQICDLMIESVKKRLKEKEINLIVDSSVRSFLTNEGYDPLYGARPLRRAIMKYLEDTLAEQCLSKTLYPNTKIIVRQKKAEGSLMFYTNELEVEVDFSDVNPSLLEPTNDSSSDLANFEDGSKKSNETNSSYSKLEFDKSDLNLKEKTLKVLMKEQADAFFN